MSIFQYIKEGHFSIKISNSLGCTIALYIPTFHCNMSLSLNGLFEVLNCQYRTKFSFYCHHYTKGEESKAEA